MMSFGKSALKLSLLLLLNSCSHLFYQPTTYQYADPAQYKMQFEDVYFNSKDGTKLHGWFFRAQGPKVRGTIVHFHGNAQNLSAHFLNLVWSVKEGFNYFIFDYRGYGKSEGKPTQESVNQDALSAMNKGYALYLKHPGGKFIVYGQSLGSIISMRALKDWDQSKVDLLVQDSSFYSYTKIAFDKLSDVWFLVPLSPLAYLLVSNEYASKSILQDIKVPLLVITSKKDKITPPMYGRYIYKNAGAQHKWWWKSETAEHIEIFFSEGGKFRQEFINLIDQI